MLPSACGLLDAHMFNPRQVGIIAAVRPPSPRCCLLKLPVGRAGQQGEVCRQASSIAHFSTDRLLADLSGGG